MGNPKLYGTSELIRLIDVQAQNLGSSLYTLKFLFLFVIFTPKKEVR